MRKHFRTFVFIGFGIMGLASCQESSTSKKLDQKIESLFTDQKNKIDRFTLSSEKEEILQLATGTSIVITENCLVDADGHLFKGEYELSFTEMHSIEEILRSGIPMEVEENGQIGLMTTGGMFNIQAKDKNNNALFIQKGKKIDIKMADSHPENDYNLYRFVANKTNEASFLQVPIITLYQELTEGKWVMEEKLETSVNPDKEAAEKKLPQEPEKPVEPVHYTEGKFTFNIKADLNAYPELKALKGVFWQFSGANPTQDPEKNPWVFTYKNWQNIKITGTRNGSSYVMEFISDEKNFITEVVPALDENEFETAMIDFKERLEKYNATQESYVKKRYEAQRIGAYIRSFGVQEFGIHNVDAILRAMNQSTKIDLVLNSPSSSKIENFYLVSAQNGRKTALKYTEKNKGTFFYFEGFQNMIVAPLPNGKVAYISAQEFENQTKNSSDEVKITLKEDLYANIVPQLEVTLN